MQKAVIILLLGLAGCGNASGEVTLYRNSPIDATMRVHFASFNAEESIDFNFQNCMMAARLLNANVAALAEEQGKTVDPTAGFWCEAGAYDDTGMNPVSFSSGFPTTTDTGW